MVNPLVILRILFCCVGFLFYRLIFVLWLPTLVCYVRWGDLFVSLDVIVVVTILGVL
jgi:hypothetical protein